MRDTENVIETQNGNLTQKHEHCTDLYEYYVSTMRVLTHPQHTSRSKQM
jgi:hypothetical protein